ncbi:MAG TPA: hypothetical protein VKA51_02135 [Rubrobacteraceae bacterium]|nr:hypothetical protein [Rubrobacteraceae bacterium]
MRAESRHNALGGAIGFALAWVLLSFVASSLVEGLPNIWWLGVPGAVVVYLLVRRFGGVIRRRP